MSAYRAGVSLVVASIAGLLPASTMGGNPTVPGGAALEGSSFHSLASSGGVDQFLYLDTAGGLGGSGLRPGDTITGISLRFDGSVSNDLGAFFDRFDIRIGQGVSNVTTNFDDNFFGPATQVRTGPLFLFTGEMSLEGNPKGFGSAIKFNKSWKYPGGNLLIEFRHNSPSSTLFLDLDETGNKSAGVSSAGNPDATTGFVTIGDGLVIAFEVIRGGKQKLTSITVPVSPSTESSAGNSWSIPFRYQFHYPPSALSTLSPGDKICGFCLRRGTYDTGTANPVFERFDVSIGRASEMYSDMVGTTFTDNYATAPTLARSGPLTLIYPNSPSTVKPFGGFVSFDAPFTYTGGSLILEWQVSKFSINGPRIDFTNQNGVSGLTSNVSADAATSNSQGAFVPVLQLKVIKDNSKLIAALNAKIKKLKRQLRKAKAGGKTSKVRALNKKIRRLKKRLSLL